MNIKPANNQNRLKLGQTTFRADTAGNSSVTMPDLSFVSSRRGIGSGSPISAPFQPVLNDRIGQTLTLQQVDYHPSRSGLVEAS